MGGVDALVLAGGLVGLLAGLAVERSAWLLVGEPARGMGWRLGAAVLSAALWAATASAAAGPAAAVYRGALASLAVLITVTDVARRTIPNLALLAATLLWLPLWLVARPGPLAGGPVGAVVFAGPLWVAARLRPGDMGTGDVKLATVLGLYLGFPACVPGLILGVVAGGIGAALALLRPATGRRGTIPYGPFLAAGAMVALIWGTPLLRLLGA
jgi:leader peptidase (prepilin peptidase)/N-methyltransferase